MARSLTDWDFAQFARGGKRMYRKLGGPNRIGVFGAVAFAVLGCQVTGAENQGATADFEQAEAVASQAISSANEVVVSVAFNDRTQDSADPKIIYPDGPSGTQRIVKYGVSLMGWSYSVNAGDFQYGGRVNPPAGWGAVWGDPSLTTSKAFGQTNNVYLANLAGSDLAFPPGSELQNATPSLDGFCIARSSNAGVSFNEIQCFKKGTCSNTGVACRGRPFDCPGVIGGPGPGNCNGIFYDGTALESWSNDIYFASNAVAADEMHVWRAQNGQLDGFQLLSDFSPFDSVQMASHPRLRVARRKLYIVGMRSDGIPMASMCNLDNGCTSWTAPLGVGAFIATSPYALADGRNLRQANEFSFDLGLNATGQWQFRIIYTRRNSSGRFYLETALCNPDLSPDPNVPGFAQCTNTGTFGGENQDPSADLFSPLIKAGATWFEPFMWRAMYLRRALGSSTLEVMRANFNESNVTLESFQVHPPQNPCTFPAPGGHYWGDYNDLISVVPNGDAPRFLAPYTMNIDDDGVCEWQGEWTADMHVGAVLFE